MEKAKPSWGSLIGVVSLTSVLWFSYFFPQIPFLSNLVWFYMFTAGIGYITLSILLLIILVYTCFEPLKPEVLYPMFHRTRMGNFIYYLTFSLCVFYLMSLIMQGWFVVAGLYLVYFIIYYLFRLASYESYKNQQQTN